MLGKNIFVQPLLLNFTSEQYQKNFTKDYIDVISFHSSSGCYVPAASYRTTSRFTNTKLMQKQIILAREVQTKQGNEERPEEGGKPNPTETKQPKPHSSQRDFLL